MAILQDDFVKIYRAQIVNHFHTLINSPLSPDLKFIESLWDVLK